uniref:Uncharacterized protein n=1 Tax=Anguilla anguilla TaxID=7936 RepID=A0A0E9XNI9_ANGAN
MEACTPLLLISQWEKVWMFTTVWGIMKAKRLKEGQLTTWWW